MEEEKRSHKLLNFLIILFLIFIGMFLYARYLGTTGLIVKEYKITNKKIPSNFDGVKIVHISDIHYGNTTLMKDIKRMVNKVNELKPDLIVFTGDLIDENYKLSKKDEEQLTTLLLSLDNNLGKYAVKGEIDNNALFNNIMKNSGFICLNNNYDLIYNKGLTPIYLAGSEDALTSTINLDKMFSYHKDNKKRTYEPTYKIVLTHEGDNASDIIRYDKSVDLVLAGHSHNGQIVLPFYGGIYMKNGSKKYGAPHYSITGSEIYVSSGIGTSEFDYRFLNKPSINFYRLESA